ncbi:SMI1/KNR4 family protein [Actinopolyspora mortivallis]|uniref:SMI1/KNR4 family protein n=1 Tax=Actinopolyspora mortivallis TaxID=33906 RepID=UPI0015E5BD04|nr:SMI1/KNR4 family protein [Actinopolyspora mortivallis]
MSDGDRNMRNQMSSCVGRLKRLLPPPEEAAGAVDWNVVEESLGVRLPSDYKEFMDTYGGGTIEDFLIIYRFADNIEGTLEIWRNEMWRVRYFWDEVPEWVILEEKWENILPWANTVDDDVCYLLMEPREDPEQWCVVSRDEDMDWSVFEGSMVEFLEEVVAGRRRESWMPYNFPGEEPWFKTTAQYLADTDPG